MWRRPTKSQSIQAQARQPANTNIHSLAHEPLLFHTPKVNSTKPTCPSLLAPILCNLLGGREETRAAPHASFPGTACRLGMWTNMATSGAHCDAEESVGLLSGLETTARHDKEIARGCWYDGEEMDIKQLSGAGGKASSTLQRREQPSYSRLETRGIGDRDWRGVSAVSFLSLCLCLLNTILAPSSVSFFTQVLSVLSVHITIVVLCFFIVCRHSLSSDQPSPFLLLSFRTVSCRAAYTHFPTNHAHSWDFI